MSVSSSNTADVRVQSRTTHTAFVIALSVALLGTLLPIETAQAQAKMARAVVDTSGPTQLIETSANAMVRRLGAKRWIALHRLVYLVAPLAVLHFWWMVKRDLTEPIIYAMVLAGLLGARLVWRARERKAGLTAQQA